MKTSTMIFAPVVAILGSLPALGQSEAPCPRTTAHDPYFGAWRPGWYGSEGLAVELGSDQVWGTTAPRARIAQKLFWWSAAFRLGTESDLKVEIVNFNGAPMTARVTDTTNAYLGELQKVHMSQLFETSGAPDKWFMLVGLDFPDPGCWQITGEFLGQKLTFVVETAQSESPATRER